MMIVYHLQSVWPVLRLFEAPRPASALLTPKSAADRIQSVTYEAERLALEWWLDRVRRRWQTFSSRLPNLPQRRVVLLSLGALVAYTALIRCLHLLVPDHHYILSPDSYFFHWVAQGIMEGEPPPSGPFLDDTYWLHSGLAYPLAYTAKAISSVFNVSSASALDFASKVFPPLIGVVTMLVLYAAATRIAGRRAGLLSAFVWGSMFWAYLVGTAGYIDRDGFSVLLLTTGAFVFYFSRQWHLIIGGRNVGWLAGGVIVLAIEATLYLEWSAAGAALLLVVLGAYALVRFLIGYTGRLQAEPSVRLRVTGSLSEINQRALAVVAVGNIAMLVLLAAVSTGVVTSWFDLAKSLIQSGGEAGAGKALGGVAIAEMRGIGPEHVYVFRFLLIPMALGLYVAWRRRNEGVIFVAVLFLSLVALSFISSRLMIYAAPAASLLAGLGLAFLWDWQRRGSFEILKKAGLGLLLAAIVFYAVAGARILGSSDLDALAPGRGWQDALAYLRRDTPAESKIMTHWDYGYWILDLGQRRPVMDNGYYYFDQERLHDVGVAYTTNDPQETADMMAKHGAEYLIFSARDELIAGPIMEGAELGPEFFLLSEFPPDSMVIRSLSGEFESGGGLEVVFRSAPDSSVVILQLIDDGHT